MSARRFLGFARAVTRISTRSFEMLILTLSLRASAAHRASSCCHNIYQPHAIWNQPARSDGLRRDGTRSSL
ncbi:hypothetical protein F5Y09DRAFT_295054 [Xylaria sp. FL1042]|nr:hypothetical protein F5Y09DRAFT_295054 [Xylaria sp. FL1042]